MKSAARRLPSRYTHAPLVRSIAPVAVQLLDLAVRACGEHADRAHTDHDLAGWADDAGNFDPTPGEADVGARPSPVSQGPGYVKVTFRSCRG
jgi:hypothetical protein